MNTPSITHIQAWDFDANRRTAVFSHRHITLSVVPLEHIGLASQDDLPGVYAFEMTQDAPADDAGGLFNVADGQSDAEAARRITDLCKSLLDEMLGVRHETIAVLEPPQQPQVLLRGIAAEHEGDAETLFKRAGLI